jgi:hypothetical protein
MYLVTEAFATIHRRFRPGMTIGTPTAEHIPEGLFRRLLELGHIIDAPPAAPEVSATATPLHPAAPVPL